MGVWSTNFGNYRFTIPRMGRLREDSAYDDFRLNWAIKSIQNELMFLGFDPGNNFGKFTRRTKRAVKDFQSTRELTIDGQVGLKTAKELFQPRINFLTESYGLHPKILCGMVFQESAYDPGAVGSVNPNDRGLVQINSAAHPDITDEAAFNAQFSLDWAAKNLKSAFRRFKKLTSGDIVLSWKCAIASHNNPTKAKEWAETGVPPDEQISQYVEKILSHCGAIL